jgi:hypothetical protein
MGAEVTRRDAILAAAAAALAGGVPAAVWAQAEVTAAEFLALSERLTGTSGLDQGVAETYLGAFLAAGQGPALRELVGASGDPTTPLADAIVAAWYSGLYETGGGQAVGDFGGALVWNALAFTKPFAECGGVTGYWADPPEG